MHDAEADLRAYLAGVWRLDRWVDDRRAGRAMRFAGEARFEPDGGALSYREDGTLDTGAGILRAVRRHRWTFEGPGARVSFDDGRPFHQVAPRGGRAADVHDCPPDLYRVAYAFETSDRWTATWRVSGPRKDYTLESLYTRLHPGALPVQSPRD